MDLYRRGTSWCGLRRNSSTSDEGDSPPSWRLTGNVPALLRHYDRIIGGKAQYERLYLFLTPASGGYGLETMDRSPI